MQGNRTVTTPPFRRRSSHSADLDVFDATQYFSGGMDGAGFSCTSSRVPSYRPTMMRRSLEVPTMAVLPCQEPTKVSSKSPNKEEKKYKQPISPGSRLASFLNSFFQQTLSKKKKSKCLKDDEDGKVVNGGRRRRRSRVSNPESFSCASKKISSPNQKLAHKGTEPGHGIWKQRAVKFSETGNEGKFSGIGFGERKWVLRRSNGTDGLIMLRAREEERLRGKGKGLMWKKDEEDESDSSSDLFELKSYDLGDLSCELPVYGTTDAGVMIRR